MLLQFKMTRLYFQLRYMFASSIKKKKTRLILFIQFSQIIETANLFLQQGTLYPLRKIELILFQFKMNI